MSHVNLYGGKLFKFHPSSSEVVCLYGASSACSACLSVVIFVSELVDAWSSRMATLLEKS